MEHKTFVKEDELSSLSLEILDCTDRISEIFNRMNECMERVPSNYAGEACTAILNHYKEISSYYSTVKKNLISYSDDLTTLIKMLKENDHFLASLFNEVTSNTKIKHKSVNIEGGK